MYDTGQRPPRVERDGEGGGKIWFIAAGVVLIALILFIVRPWGKDDPVAGGTPAARDTDRAAAPRPATNPRPGIGIGRGRIVQALKVAPYLFTFREGGTVNGESNYLGTSRKVPRATIQLLGRPDDVAEAAYIDVVPLDTPWRVVTESTAMTFTAAIDSGATSWAGELLGRIRQRKGAFGTKEIGGRLWTLSFSRLGNEGHFLVRVTTPSAARRAADSGAGDRR